MKYNELYHSDTYLGSEFDEGLYHFKYIDKYKIKGKWRYIYDKAKGYAKSAKDLITGKNNMFDMDPSTYEAKKKQIEQTQEWQDILRRKDPEYFKKDSDGNLVPDIDMYIVKKKHAILDTLTDIGDGRKVKTNKQDIKTFVAGAKDYIRAGKNMIENVLTIGVGLTIFKIMNQQGSLESQKQEISNNINTGKKLVNTILNSYQPNTKSIKQNIVKTADSVYNEGVKAYNSLDPEYKKKKNQVANSIR